MGKVMGAKGKQAAAIKKIKSQEGVSFLMALLFFLTCALTGSALLSMAQSYGRRSVIKPERAAQSLALMSAMEFVKGQLEGCSGVWDFDLVDTDMESELQWQIVKELREFGRAYMDNPYTPARRKLLSISLEEEENWSMPQVEVTMTFRGQDFQELSFEDTEEKAVSIQLEAVFFLAGEKEGSGINLTAYGTVMYEEDDYIEIQWEDMVAKKG